MRKGGEPIMAYKTPELLLVGSAQNVVLSLSDSGRKFEAPCGAEDIASGDLYDQVPLW